MGAPNWTGPRVIAMEASDNVDMELGHHIAKRGNVDLVGRVQPEEGTRGTVDLRHEDGLIRRIKIMHVTHVRARGDKDQPWVAAVL